MQHKMEESQREKEELSRNMAVLQQEKDQLEEEKEHLQSQCEQEKETCSQLRREHQVSTTEQVFLLLPSLIHLFVIVAYILLNVLKI